MTKKVNPIGFRLGITVDWVLPVNLLDSIYNGQTIFITFYWLLGFCQRNAFYLLTFTKILINSFFDLLFLTFILPYGFKLLIKKKKKFFLLDDGVFISKIRLNKRRAQKPFRNVTKLKFFLQSWRFLVKKAFIKSSQNYRRCLFHFFKSRFLFQYEKFSLNFFVKRCFSSFNSTITFFHYTCRLNRKKNLLWQRWLITPRFKNFFLRLKMYKNYGRFLKIKKKTKKFFYKKLKLKLYIASKIKKNSKNLIKYFINKKPLELKKKVLQKVSFFLIKYSYYRLILLRLKFFFEKLLLKYNQKKLIISLGNFTDFVNSKITFSPKIMSFFFFKAIRGFTNSSIKKYESQKYNFLTLCCTVFVGCTTFRNPDILLQWLWRYSIKIKKNSLYLTQSELLHLFTRLLKAVGLFFGFFKGLRIELNGKFNKNMRRQHRMSLYGKSFQRQQLVGSFVYATKHIPNYFGVFGCRLWLIY